MDKYIVAIEPGSSKIRAALATVDPAGAVTIKAIEEERIADLVCHGVVRNAARTAEAVRNVVKRLEQSQGGGSVKGVYVALGGRSLQALPVDVERRLPADTVVTDAHLDTLRRDAAATVLSDRDIVEVVPREFFTDNHRVDNPFGTIAQELRATYNVINCRQQLKRNLNHVFDKQLGMPVNGFIVRQTAQADLALTDEEKRIGCMFVDFGAETTTVSIYRAGTLRYLATLPMGSRNITRDLASLTHLEEQAERIKLEGNAMGEDMYEYSELMTARSGEIVANIIEQIKYAGMTAADLPGGIVITGAGARLSKFVQRLEQASDLPVRLGRPHPRIRIADSSSVAADALDVIAVAVAAAAIPDAPTCFEEYIETIPADTEPAVTEIDEQTAQESEEPEPAEMDIPTIGKPSKISNWISAMRRGMASLIEETDDDELNDDDDLASNKSRR